jgi:general secretion pathway protein K
VKNKPGNEKKGAVLLFALVCLLALSSLVILSVGKASREAVEARRLAAEYQADLMAESLLDIGRELLRLDKDTLSDTPDDPWASPYADDEFAMVIEPCNARLNLNEALYDERVLETLKRLLENTGVHPDNTEFLLDWLDTDSKEERVTGSEEGSYTKTWPKYRPRNGDMPVPDEILLVNGFSGLGRDWIEDRLTVWSQKQINLNFVSKELFEAYLPEIAADWNRVLEWRESEGFQTKGDLTEALPALEGDADLWKTVSDAISLRSNFFRITIEIQLPFIYERRRYIVERNPILIDKLPEVVRGDVLEILPAE